MKYKITGFFEEHYCPDELALATIGSIIYPDKIQLLTYLQSASWIVMSMHVYNSEHPLSKGKTMDDSCMTYTDGIWVWNGWLATYLDWHNIPLDADFLEYIRAKNYQHQPIPDIEKENITIFFHEKMSEYGAEYERRQNLGLGS